MQGIKYILLICGIATFSFGLYGGQPGGFLAFGSSARSLGMARAFVGVADDSSAAYTNPAGMVQVSNIEGSFFQSGLYGEYSLTAFNLVYPMVDNYFGVTYTQLTSGAMDLRDKYNISQGSFTDDKTAIGLSYAQPIFLPNMSIGFAAKYLTRKLYTHTDSRVLGDISLLYRPFEFLSVGANIQNVLDFAMDTNSADKFNALPRLGVSYHDQKLTIAYDIENDLENWFIGVEYKFHELLTLRGGRNYESTNFGFSTQFAGIRFDYAYSNDELGANNRFSLNLSIGQMINDIQKESAVDWYNRGVTKYQEGFFLMALSDIKKAYILNPQDEEVIKKLQKLQKLQKLSKQLGLDLGQEKAIWPQYRDILKLVKTDQLEPALQKTNDLISRYPNNLNLLNLKEKINKQLELQTVPKE